MTQSCSQDNPPTITTAREAVVGHVEKVVQAHATTPALEHAWQAVQEGAQVVQGHVLEHAQAVQEAAKEHALPVASMPAVAVLAGHIK